MNISRKKSKILVLLLLSYLYILGTSYLYKLNNDGYKIYTNLYTTFIIDKKLINVNDNIVYEFTFLSPNLVIKNYRLVSEKEYNFYKIGDEYTVKSLHKKNQYPFIDILLMIYAVVVTCFLSYLFSRYTYWLFYRSENISFFKYLKKD